MAVPGGFTYEDQPIAIVVGIPVNAPAYFAGGSTGDTDDFKVDAGVLPPGLAIEATAGSITGTPVSPISKRTVIVSCQNEDPPGVFTRYTTEVDFVGTAVNHRSVVNVHEREANA